MSTAFGLRESKPSGNAIPPGCHLIEVRVTELRQLFNAIDPSPFRERDLDPRAEQFIVEVFGKTFGFLGVSVSSPWLRA